MKVIQQSAKILKPNNLEGGVAILKAIEYAGRNCYASQDKITDDSCYRFVSSLIKRGHESPLEFGDITFDITTSRAVLAEITRHRLCSFCVESQRYIQEAKTGDITFIEPSWAAYSNEETEETRRTTAWQGSMILAEDDYKIMIEGGAKPEEAREVLPNSTACRIIMKANVREWRHFFKMRCDKAAYPQMRELAFQMLSKAHHLVPCAFDDLYERFSVDYC